MARFSLEEVPPRRDKPKPHRRGQNNSNFNFEDSKQKVYRQQQEYAQQQAIKNKKAAKKFNNTANIVMSQLSNAASSTPVTSEEITQAINDKRQQALDKINDYKLGVRSLATAAELGLSGGSLLGAWANYKNWATAANASKKAIANLLKRAQAPMQLSGTLIDGYQTLDAATNNDEFNTYYNAGSAGLGLAGYMGARDVFRGRYPLVDRTLDVLGIIQNSGDFVKFGYDTLKGDNK